MPSCRYRAYEPGIKAQVVEMAVNSSGIRDTARVLKINKNTVISTLKKAPTLVQVNPLYLKDTGSPREVRLEPACQEAELDGQWPSPSAAPRAGAGDKSNQRWLRYTRSTSAVDHATNTACWPMCSANAWTLFSKA